MLFRFTNKFDISEVSEKIQATDTTFDYSMFVSQIYMIPNLDKTSFISKIQSKLK
jgi:hypothetical protein